MRKKNLQKNSNWPRSADKMVKNSRAENYIKNNEKIIFHSQKGIHLIFLNLIFIAN